MHDSAFPWQQLALAFPNTESAGVGFAHDDPVLPTLEFSPLVGEYTFPREGHRGYVQDAAGASDVIHSRKHSLADESFPRLSSYSSLKGWAGSAGSNSAKNSPHSPVTPLAQDADTSSIMRAAFEAASAFAPHDDGPIDVDGGAHRPAPASPEEEQYLNEYSRGKRLMNILDTHPAASASPDAEFSYAHDVYGRDIVDHADYI